MPKSSFWLSSHAEGTSTSRMALIDSSVGIITVPLERITPEITAEQPNTSALHSTMCSRFIAISVASRLFVNSPMIGAREQVAHQQQRAGDGEVDHDAGAGDRAQLLGVAGADGLRAQDGGGDGDGHGRELHVAQHLVAHAIGRGGMRTEAVDHGQQRDFGQRHDHHLHGGGNADAQHRLEDRAVDAHVLISSALGASTWPLLRR